jgi:two-component system response regulator HydG
MTGNDDTEDGTEIRAGMITKTQPIRILSTGSTPAMIEEIRSMTRSCAVQIDAVSEQAAGPGACVQALASGSYDLVLFFIDENSDPATFLGTLKRQHPSVPVIVLASNPEPETVVAMFREGAFDFLIRPFPADKLEELLGRVMERRTWGARRKKVARELETERLRVQELEGRIENTDPFEKIIGSSAMVTRLVETAREVSRTDSTVLITGESGTGKGLIAQAIHAASESCAGTFVEANCVVYSEGLLHSELFGHEKGAFTGATRRKKGRFEMAAGGTIFLDEIGDISPATQLLLLRVLQNKTFERVGGEETIESDARLIAATNRDLSSAIANGSFRSDLYYRLNVIPIQLPPLREHSEDIPALAQHFLKRFTRRHVRFAESYHPTALARMAEYPWPGNIRELENAVERMVVLCRTDQITENDLPEGIRELPGRVPHVKGTLDQIEAIRIAEALKETGGNKKLAAMKLGIHRSTLYKKIERYGLELERRSTGHGVSDSTTRAANY